MIEIDGGLGEGGGQILRSALSLSALLGKPFRMFDIRRNRQRPGLMPQHLACVRAMATVSNARVHGDEIGSLELVFKPSGIRAGDYAFDIGTAGSTSLLLQCLLPALIFSPGRSSLTLSGGTHVPFSPPFQFVSEVFLPMLSRIGIQVRASISRYGFYPRGGGRISVVAEHCHAITSLRAVKRDEIHSLRIISGVANLPAAIAERQRDAVVRGLSPLLEVKTETLSVPSFGKGTFLTLIAETSDTVAGFTALGERGKKAELVGEEAARAFEAYQRSGASLDRHLSDQIVLYLSLSREESSFSTAEVTNHLLTNLEVIRAFTAIAVAVEGEKGRPGRILFSGKRHTP